MKQYFYADEDNNAVGPVSSNRLMELHAEGVIKPTTLVTEESPENWLPLYEHNFAKPKPKEPLPEAPPAKPPIPLPTPLGNAQVAVIRVVVTDLDISFGNMISLLFKWFFATIIVGICIGLPAGFLIAVFKQM